MRDTIQYYQTNPADRHQAWKRGHHRDKGLALGKKVKLFYFFQGRHIPGKSCRRFEAPPTFGR